jgi:hypothetical protein
MHKEENLQKSHILRKTGIDILGPVPWGTHFCFFYHTAEDLIEILVPYFKIGLKNNEFCIWVTAEPLKPERAKNALGESVGNLNNYIEKGQIEIFEYSQWYLKSGEFEADKVLEAWYEKEDYAIKKGFTGMRVTGNLPPSYPRAQWQEFADYEAKVHSEISNHQVIALCAYPVDNLMISQILDVGTSHQFVYTKREGKSQIVESALYKQIKESFTRF